MKVLMPLLLMLLGFVNGQDEEVADPTDDTEEAWQYVEFLKNDINGKVEEILQKTLYTAKDKQGEGLLDDTISTAMEQVMEIREMLLTRIKDIRKDVIKTDPDQNIKQEFRIEIMTILLRIIDGSESSVEKLKEIGQDLLRFKLSVSNAVMRLMMLPSTRKGTIKQVGEGNCSECDILEDISYKVENIIACAEQDQPIEDIDLPTDQQGVIRPEVEGKMLKDEKPEPGTFCMDPSMYAMELISCNENIDTEIKNLYNKLVIETEDERRQESMESLDFYKRTRDNIDEMITKLMALSDATKLKKTVRRSLGQVSNELSARLGNCHAKCGPDGCDSCAADIIYDSIAKMNDYATFFENSEDDTAKRDFIREDMMKYINDFNAETKEILIKKVMEGNLDSCDEEKLEIFGVLKQPFWMVVQTAVQVEGSGELEIMVETMKELLGQQLENYCSKMDTPRGTSQEEGQKCDWEEYEQTKEYLIKVDEIIQDSLFKDSGENGKLDAILGFVEIQGMVDKRVKKLFEDQLVCPQEVSIIKKQYMLQLNKCMAQFMNSKVQFNKMSRIQRISCTKELRNTMEERVTKLLQQELVDTFNQLDTEVPDFLIDGEDGPITDIDLPTDQQGVVRPA